MSHQPTEQTKPPIHVSDDDYEVGYRKTPEHTKFKKGKSGNPKGRKRAEKHFVYEDPIKTLLRQNIADAIDLSDKNMPVYIGLLKVLIRKGLKSDTKAIQILFDKTNGLNSILDERRAEATEAKRAYLQRLRDDVENWN